MIYDHRGTLLEPGGRMYSNLHSTRRRALVNRTSKPMVFRSGDRWYVIHADTNGDPFLFHLNQKAINFCVQAECREAFVSRVMMSDGSHAFVEIK